MAAGAIDAIESDEPDRPLLSAPSSASNQPSELTSGEIALEEARKLTRDNPAAVANIVKTWINGEAPA
jgi:flagellar M-ring protein FliF